MHEVVLKSKTGYGGKLKLSISDHGIVNLGFSSDTNWDASDITLEERAPKYLYLKKYRGYWFGKHMYHWDKFGESTVEFTLEQATKDLTALGLNTEVIRECQR